MPEFYVIPKQAVDDLANCILIQNEILEECKLTKEQKERIAYIDAVIKNVKQCVINQTK